MNLPTEIALLDPAILERKPRNEEEMQALRLAFASTFVSTAFLLSLTRKPKVLPTVKPKALL